MAASPARPVPAMPRMRHVMIRHPHYLELPWEIHWYPDVRQHRPPWWLIMLLLVLAMLMIGAGVTGVRM
jgi:hypothetical protein